MADGFSHIEQEFAKSVQEAGFQKKGTFAQKPTTPEYCKKVLTYGYAMKITFQTQKAELPIILDTNASALKSSEEFVEFMTSVAPKIYSAYERANKAKAKE